MNLSAVYICAAMLLLSGCGNSVPECDDKEVAKILKQIIADNGGELLSNFGISTVKTEDKTRICRSLMKLKDKATGEKEDIGVRYEITLADNGQDFVVQLFPEQ